MIGKHPRQAPRTLFAQKGRPAARRISRLAEAVGASTAALKDFNVLTPNDGGYDPSSILSRPCVAFGMESGEGSSATSLTAADCAFFAANGFLLKKSLVVSRQCAAARDYLWSRAPPCLQRDEPATHVDPHFHWEATPAHTHVPSTFMTESASWKLHDCGDAPWMLRLMGAHKRVLAHVEGLVGGPIRRPTRTRGIYAVFPSTAHAALSEQGVSRALDPHNDVSAQWLNGTLYLNDTLPRSGNLVVWPGSHRLLYYSYAHEYNASRDPPVFQRLMDRVKRTITPLEICAPAGSVIFWHGRLAHSPGVHSGGEPRLAVPTDWQRQRVNGAQTEWFKDAPDFEDSGRPPQLDLFGDWRLQPAATATD